MSRVKGKSDRFIAALAVREKSPEIIAEGLQSILKSNAIDDYRDIISALILYYDAISRLDLNPDEYLKDFLETHAEFKKYIEPFISRSKENKSLKAAGYKVVLSPEFNYEYDF